VTSRIALRWSVINSYSGLYLLTFINVPLSTYCKLRYLSKCTANRAVLYE